MNTLIKKCLFFSYCSHFTLNLFAQTATKELLCKIKFTPQYNYTKWNNKVVGYKIDIEYGSKKNFLSLSDSAFLAKTEKVTELTDEIDAIYYFKSLGWEIVNITNDRNTDYIFWRKRIENK